MAVRGVRAGKPKRTAGQQAALETRWRTVKGVVYESRIDATIAQFRKMQVERLSAMANRLIERMKMYLLTPGDGRIYTADDWGRIQPKIRKKGVHQASSPNKPPTNLSWSLFHSLRKTIHAADLVLGEGVTLTNNNANDVTVEISLVREPGMQTDPNLYAAALEFGHPGGNGKLGGPVAPRPFFKPAYLAVHGHLRHYLLFPFSELDWEKKGAPRGMGDEE